VIHARPPAFELGKAITVREGTDVCLVSTGNMMPVVLAAAGLLEKDGCSARVESFHTVKPLDTARLESLFSRYSLVAVVEEHSRIGGLGGAVAEWLAAQRGRPGRLLAFGTDDAFMYEVGSQEYGRRKFGLTAENITRTVSAALAHKVTQ
jgi:transketolase